MLQRLTKSSTRGLACLAAALALSGRVPSAAAQTESGAAQALFDEAKGLMARGSYELACPKLQESQRLEPALGTLLNLADCREKEGKLASAWSLFRDAEAIAHRSGPEEAVAVARQRAAQLEQRVPRLELRLSAAAPTGFRLTRNDVVVGEAQLGTPIPLDPGTYRVTASAPGYASWETTVKLRESVGIVNVLVPVLHPARQATAVTPPPAPPATAKTESAGAPVLTWVLGGAGVVALGASTWLGLSAKSQYDSANCPQHACATKGDLDARSAARTKAAVATGLGLGGALVLGAGVVLWVVHDPGERREPHVSLSVTARELHITGTF